MSLPLTGRATQVLNMANSEAIELNHEFVSTSHLIIALANLEDSVSYQAFKLNGIHANQVRAGVKEILQPGPDMTIVGRLPRTQTLRYTIQEAERIAANLKHISVGPEHLLIALLNDKCGIPARVVNKLSNVSNILTSVYELLGVEEIPSDQDSLSTETILDCGVKVNLTAVIKQKETKHSVEETLHKIACLLVSQGVDKNITPEIALEKIRSLVNQ